MKKLSVVTATQAINALTDYRDSLASLETMRELLAEQEADLQKKEDFLASLGLFGVTVASSIPEPSLPAVEPVAVNLPGVSTEFIPEPVSQVPAPKVVLSNPAAPTKKRGHPSKDETATTSAAPRVCPGFNRKCGTPITNASKTGFCMACAVTKSYFDRKKAAAEAEKKAVADIPSVEAAPVIEIEVIEDEVATTPSDRDAFREAEDERAMALEEAAIVENERVPEPPKMPSCKISILENTALFRYVYNARNKAMNDPEVIASGVCHLSWQWSDDLNRWDAVYSPWEVEDTSLGLIEHLRRQGKDFVNTSGQIVGRAQS